MLQPWDVNVRRSEDDGIAALQRRIWSLSGSSLRSAEGGHNGIRLSSIFLLWSGSCFFLEYSISSGHLWD